MFTRSSFQPRDLAALAVVIVIAIGGLAALRFAPTAAGTDDDQDHKEFVAELAGDAKSIDGMIADSKAGKNVTEFRIGMFMMSLLGTLSDEDDTLGGYFHKNGRLMEDYLRNVFQYHSEDEVAAVAAMAKQGNPGIRQSAQYALESLRHIPESKDPPANQDEDRKALVDTLTALKRHLAEAAKE